MAKVKIYSTKGTPKVFEDMKNFVAPKPQFPYWHIERESGRYFIQEALVTELEVWDEPKVDLTGLEEEL